MLLVLQLFLIFVCAVESRRETHRLVKITNGIEIVQDVVRDTDEDTMVISVGQIPVKGQLSTINFHDFKTNHLAYKTIRNGVCFLTTLPDHSVEQANEAVVFVAKLNKTPMNHGLVTSRAGDKIADFCKDYKTFWIDLIPGEDASKKTRRDFGPVALQMHCASHAISVSESMIEALQPHADFQDILTHVDTSNPITGAIQAHAGLNNN